MIPDLLYKPDYISADAEQSLIQTIDAQIWMSPFKRRVQHYGYVYDYKKRKVTEEMRLGTLPYWLQNIAERLFQDGVIEAVPDQVIINEYEAGQGIAPHVDCEPCFGDTIISLTLGSGCNMDFAHVTDKAHFTQYLDPRSLIVMQGQARYQWTHGIRGRKTDMVNGKRIKRARRISLTFRRVILDYSK